jgi:hypothetical protein
MAAGRHAEGLQVTLAALRQYPTRVENARNQLRSRAGCYIVNCANGNGANALPLGERPAYRKQALDLLTAELAAYQKLADDDWRFVQVLVRHWLETDDLASVRDPSAIEQLPPDEREAWKKLWADVRDLRDRTAPHRKPLHRSRTNSDTRNPRTDCSH